jgi:predicted permease
LTHEPLMSVAQVFTSVAHDLRYAGRLLLRQPGYAAVVILTMALGIGATTTLFSVTYGVLLKPLPWPDADRLVRLYETRQGSTRRIRPVMTNATYLAWREQPSTIEGLAAWSGGTWTLTGEGDPERLEIAQVTASVFALLRARPIAGALFEPGDEAPGRGRVVVLSFGLWQSRFGGRPDAIGRSVTLDGDAHTIVAVMPREFVFPDRDTRAWVPFHVRPVVGDDPKMRSLSMFNAIARLAPGATPAQAAAEGTSRGRGAPDPGLGVMAVFGSHGPVEVTAVPVLDAMTADVRPALVVFLAAVALLLVTATANVASLQLARATTRHREMAIRSAVGAGRGRLARQLLQESAALGLAGGVTGLLLSIWLHGALPAILPADFPRLDDIAIDARAAAFAIVLSLVAGLAFGLGPALRARRLSLVQALNEEGLAPAGVGLRSRTARARALIMIGQVAIATLLLVGSALLARSFVALLSVDPGYERSNLLTARVPLPDRSYDPMRRAQFLTSLIERIRTLPGVTHAAVTTNPPLSGMEQLMAIRMPSRRAAEGTVQIQAAVRIVSPDVFETLGTRVIAGRAFTDADTTTSAHVVVVNRAFASQYLDDTPVGEEIPAGFNEGSRAWRVVGVVGNIAHRGVTDAAQPEIYVSYRQLLAGFTFDWPMLLVRSAGDPRDLVAALRAAVRDADAAVALESVMTMEDRVRESLARPRLYALLLGCFAAFALAIAGVGLFGVLSYAVAQRTREIGIRLALGARPGDVARQVVLQGLVMAAAGLAVGLAAAFTIVRFLSAFLHGVTARDPMSFAGGAALILAVSIAACLAPMRRATRVDPLKALRAQR